MVLPLPIFPAIAICISVHQLFCKGTKFLQISILGYICIVRRPVTAPGNTHSDMRMSIRCQNGAFPAPESLLAGSSVSKRVFFCAKSCNGWSLVLKLGISCTGSVGECGGECSSVPKRGHCCAGIPRGRAPAFFAPFFSLFLQNGQYRIVYWTEEDDGAATAAEIPV